MKSSSINRPTRDPANEIVFIPGFDLLEEVERHLSVEEIAAIATALIQLLPDTAVLASTEWITGSRLEGTSRRL